MRKSIVRNAAVAATTLVVLGAPLVRADDTAALWSKHCASCHGEDGKGDTKPGKALKIRDMTAPDVHKTLDKAKVRESIEKGVTSPETGKTVMKGFADKLSAADMDALAAHVMSLK